MHNSIINHAPKLISTLYNLVEISAKSYMGPRPIKINLVISNKQNNVGSYSKKFNILNKQLGNNVLQNQEGSCTFESRVHVAPSQYRYLHSGTLHTHQRE